MCRCVILKGDGQPTYCWRNLQQMRQSEFLHASSDQETYNERHQLYITMESLSKEPTVS